ncbi:3,5-dihydroxyphenylacetyl-CoA synthase DpgA [Sphingomonas sanguinis]|uniref:Stilbene synthase n=1 Tax=Sphingomonas sanguinis TaxID=33051 RepID=A0A147HTE8_9SPHN|nr:3,5-dihydroxyphenylacetyl-CoA synthase DpgA [Sphingomonas sanguinis]KTT68087.1 stilbene synthase [Sphingomonas sanguinis]
MNAHSPAGFNSSFPRPKPVIAAVGTALPQSCYTQAEILEIFRIEDRRTRSIFLNGGIEKRHLVLPPELPDGTRAMESQKALLEKHLDIALDIGAKAIIRCLDALGAARSDVRHLCCVSTTGFLTPGLSAHLIKHIGLSPTCSRIDVVGMGCNAGLNALSAVSGWSEARPGELAIMLCVEICSALYVIDGKIETAVVNSLFGDGAAAIAVITGNGSSEAVPTLLRFSSLIIPDAISAMRTDWDDDHHKFSFRLDQNVPYVVGNHCVGALAALMDGSGINQSSISHWLIHSGGKKVIDSVRVNLGLSQFDVRHTLGVLRDHGNLSSGSFLFSYERLLSEKRANSGDYGVLMTMGPGSTIEMALLQWASGAN